VQSLGRTSEVERLREDDQLAQLTQVHGDIHWISDLNNQILDE
jgi:hypothetical protein